MTDHPEHQSDPQGSDKPRDPQAAGGDSATTPGADDGARYSSRSSAHSAFESSVRPKRLRRWTLAGLAAMAVGVFAFHSVTQAQGGPGFMHRHGKMDAETMGKFIDWRVSAMLSQVDATAEQKARITEIAKSALKELTPLREQHQAARTKAMDLLVQPTIDRAALEQVRAEELRLAETVSKRAAQVVADAAEVLTPAQRQQLVARWKARHA